MQEFTGENPTISSSKCRKTISASFLIKNTVNEHDSSHSIDEHDSSQCIDEHDSSQSINEHDSSQCINCRRLTEFKIKNSITWGIPKRKVSVLNRQDTGYWLNNSIINLNINTLWLENTSIPQVDTTEMAAILFMPITEREHLFTQRPKFITIGFHCQ
jgi:hypothetical protein